MGGQRRISHPTPRSLLAIVSTAAIKTEETSKYVYNMCIYSYIQHTVGLSLYIFQEPGHFTASLLLTPNPNLGCLSFSILGVSPFQCSLNWELQLSMYIYMNFRLNSLKAGYKGDYYIGEYYKDY